MTEYSVLNAKETEEKNLMPLRKLTVDGKPRDPHSLQALSQHPPLSPQESKTADRGEPVIRTGKTPVGQSYAKVVNTYPEQFVMHFTEKHARRYIRNKFNRGQKARSSNP